MQKHWLKRIGAPDLDRDRLLSAGLSEPRLVQNIADRGVIHVLVLYDYLGRWSRSRQPIRPPMDRSTSLAWSFGVWVAEQVCRDIPFRRAVALNGTPLPVDARYGIPPQAMAVTRQGIRRTGNRPVRPPRLRHVL